MTILFASSMLLAAAVSFARAAPTQCPSPTKSGCSMPSWPVTYAMKSSGYMYCFETCPLLWFENHTSVGLFQGVIGVDHYWTYVSRAAAS